MASSEEHEQAIRERLEEMEPPEAFALAAACAERQWPIYERASAGKPWSQPEVLRRALDAVWDWLLRKRGRPQGLARQCEAAILDEIEDDEDQAASNVANMIYGLASVVESERKDQVLFAARENLAFIEAFVSELLDLAPTPENMPAIESHVLMQAEIRRQQDDLALLSRGVSLPAVIEGVRLKSSGVSILGDYWYGA